MCNTFQALYIEQHYKAIAIICALQAHNNVGNRNETSCSVQSPEFIFRRISVSFSTSWTGAFICSLLSFYLYSLISVFGITVRSFTQSSVGLSRNVNKNSSEQIVSQITKIVRLQIEVVWHRLLHVEGRQIYIGNHECVYNWMCHRRW